MSDKYLVTVHLEFGDTVESSEPIATMGPFNLAEDAHKAGEELLKMANDKLSDYLEESGVWYNIVPLPNPDNTVSDTFEDIQRFIKEDWGH